MGNWKKIKFKCQSNLEIQSTIQNISVPQVQVHDSSPPSCSGNGSHLYFLFYLILYTDETNSVIVIVRSHTVLVLECDINQVVQGDCALCINNRFGICLSCTFGAQTQSLQIKIQWVNRLINKRPLVVVHVQCSTTTVTTLQSMYSWYIYAPPR